MDPKNSSNNSENSRMENKLIKCTQLVNTLTRQNENMRKKNYELESLLVHRNDAVGRAEDEMHLWRQRWEELKKKTQAQNKKYPQQYHEKKDCVQSLSQENQ